MQFWNLLARFYDPFVYLVLRRAYRSLEQWAPCQVPAGCTILELGAGTGALTTVLAPGARRYLATDVSWRMLERLRTKLAGQYAVETRVLDAAGPLPSGPFDVVVAANLLHLLDDPRSTLRAVLEVLTPGGLLLAPTFLLGGSWFARMARRLGFPVRHSLTQAGLLQLLRECGFEPTLHRVVPGLVPLALVVARPVAGVGLAAGAQMKPPQ